MSKGQNAVNLIKKTRKYAETKCHSWKSTEPEEATFLWLLKAYSILQNILLSVRNVKKQCVFVTKHLTCVLIVLMVTWMKHMKT